MWEPLRSLLQSGRSSTGVSDQIAFIALTADAADRRLLSDLAARTAWTLHFAETCALASAALHRLEIPIILCDRDLPGAEWRHVLRSMSAATHHPCAILLSSVIDDYLWNEVIGNGGYDVLPKPLQERDVARTLRLAHSYWSTSMKSSPFARHKE